MKTKEIIHHNLAVFAAVMTFLLFLPLFSEKPSFTQRYAGISAEVRPLFVQLAGRTETAVTSPVSDVRNDGTSDIAAEEFGEAYAGLENSAQSFEIALVYQAAASTSTQTGETEAEYIFSMLQEIGTQMEGSLAYSAPVLNNRRDRHRKPAI